MEHPEELVAAIMEEDRLLRQRVTQCPEHLRETHGAGGSLSLKDTLGHLAFWDSYAVSFFTRKLDGPIENDAPPVNFEQRSREELRRVRTMPFPEVVELYGLATRDLVHFLRTRWHDLSEKQRLDFSLPLKHRRHHRLLLDKALGADLWEKEEEA